MYIRSEAGKTIFIKNSIFRRNGFKKTAPDAETERIMKKNTSLRKERLILLSASAFVLTALTMTGVYMREKDNISDENRLQAEEIKSEEIAEKITEIANEEYKDAHDMDADPDAWDVDTYHVQALLENVEEQKANKEPETAAPAQEVPAEETVAQNDVVIPDEHFVFPMEQHLTWPIVGEIIMNYSMDQTILFETLGQYRYNPAVIVAATPGDMIKAPANCAVKEISTNMEIGKYMVLDLGDGYEMTLGQIDGVNFNVGDKVDKGVVLATLATPSLYYTEEGPNLYMKLEKDGEPIDPVTVLN